MKAPLRLTDRKREAIVLAAIAEFRVNGFDVTSMDKIAAVAQVSKRTVYNHFPSKEELFSEILQRLWTSSTDLQDMTYHPERPLRDQLKALLESKMRTLADSNFIDLARVAIAATIHSPERAQNMVSRLNEREESFTAWIRAAQLDGRFKAVDPSFAATQIHALIKAFAFWPQITQGAETLASCAQESVMESTLSLFLGWYEIPTAQ
ncbi:TetR/AcrR family transcriptional regulator [Pseudomonas sp. 10B1]|uniref:TetR/AcrR family transcriptional regulator n=1 Tax=unclassified Pseudomonas TaxID=196821 RepID=UPI002AB34DAD|nr:MULTISPECIES: TetR/AcrR family transcriptional regulator [unclassified Pseudomonas]MDY7560940.1 TetR/AcrR family transcriptional regulator [Pseudomonas sp. AB6]MEA9978269.1 TetR/AcrR family transcriptional regulator [Pseudomonas sp. RTS4]MEA9995131.1 TetR/AcrR family transcriptional regulator [Pseudomonas sp. AA4]MEB0086981.1 TetR/AcrR family transcriptional regulator [Pseudomonas sp. RTI1]MEB0126752.1 TetR/AcrR family transcriptional regulator [Pseudomonas sp. CCC1.2]